MHFTFWFRPTIRRRGPLGPNHCWFWRPPSSIFPWPRRDYEKKKRVLQGVSHDGRSQAVAAFFFQTRFFVAQLCWFWHPVASSASPPPPSTPLFPTFRPKVTPRDSSIYLTFNSSPLPLVWHFFHLLFAEPSKALAENSSPLHHNSSTRPRPPPPPRLPPPGCSQPSQLDKKTTPEGGKRYHIRRVLPVRPKTEQDTKPWP